MKQPGFQVKQPGFQVKNSLEYRYTVKTAQNIPGAKIFTPALTYSCTDGNPSWHQISIVYQHLEQNSSARCNENISADNICKYILIKNHEFPQIFAKFSQHFLDLKIYANYVCISRHCIPMYVKNT